MTNNFIKAGEEIIRIDLVESINIESIDQGKVIITHSGGKESIAMGFDAIEAVMLLKPSALEGRRLRWQRNAWAFHNMIAHPLMQIMVWLGFKKQAIKLHDITTPQPRGFKMSISDDALKSADHVIKKLIEAGAPDYSSKRQEIADLFDNHLWQGNWDCQTDFEDDMQNLRFIQEDEFDQSMDDESKDGMKEICFSEGHYIFYED